MKILRLFYKEKDLVISPKRHPMPISQVAENVNVVTAEEIKKMNAHTVAEVLNRLSGVFIIFTQDFGASSKIGIQGSEDRHVLVLLDGVPFNFLSEGTAETGSIPVGIISRIEIIKGPASSAWGSSLGGVINIITKPAGYTEKPQGSLSASYGEKNTQDYRVEISGQVKSMGYYLYAGHQDSDGLRDSKNFKNNSFYSKIRIPFSVDLVADLSIGYNKMYQAFGDFHSNFISSAGDSRNFFITASLDATLTKKISGKISFYNFNQEFIQKNSNLGLEPIDGNFFPDGELFSKNIFDEKTFGGGAKIVWDHRPHTAVFGTDFNCGDLHQKRQYGTFLKRMGLSEMPGDDTGIDKWAIYLNDTFRIKNWSITPGIRFDHNKAIESFISPSLGVTYTLSNDSILKASVARGFNIQPLAMVLANPDLKPEKVWSYRTGIESTAPKYFGVKAIAFYHEMENSIDFSSEGKPITNDKKKIKRKGFEIETETIPFYNLSLLVGISYAKLNPSNEMGSNEIYTYNIGIKYDDKKSFNALLFGHYINWDLDRDFDTMYHFNTNDFIWDLNFNKKIYKLQKRHIESFFTAHNIFNGSQYISREYLNPKRWIEAGLRITF